MSYGDAFDGPGFPLDGTPTDVSQPEGRSMARQDAFGCFGEIWYDLNINGEASDLTATFELKWADDGITVHLNDIHVM